ncbi:MAG: zf-HC2 domain-containing protein [Bacteroidota bacterium]
MKNCRDIKPLLYLHRKGELTPEEDFTVRTHLEACSNCAGIRQALSEIDDLLLPGRSAAPTLRNDRILIERALAGVDRKDQRNRSDYTEILDRILSWGRPALATVVATMACLFVFQETRDALKTSSLERRLQVRGDASIPHAMALIPYAMPSGEIFTPGEIRTFLSNPRTTAGVGEDQLKILGSILPGIFGSSDDLFTRLATRYPNIARVTFDDGLDEEERTILATEGKSLMKELETLLSQGAQDK